MDELAMAYYLVTCETPSCGNSDHAINIPAPAVDPYFVCGVCGQQITNIQSVGA